MESFDESLKYLLHEEPADFLRFGFTDPTLLIVLRHDQNSSRRADHLAILWFVAEAEDVPTDLVKSYIKEAQLMESALYKNIFAKGEARGEARGEAQAYASTIHKLLVRRLGLVDATLRERIATFPSPDVIAAWHDEALDVNDVVSARKLLDKILQTPVPPPAEDSSRAA